MAVKIEARLWKSGKEGEIEVKATCDTTKELEEIVDACRSRGIGSKKFLGIFLYGQRGF